MTTLSDRVAVVTGAAHGIGHAIAVALATAGADVVAVDIDKAGAEKTAAAVAAAGRRSLTLATDSALQPLPGPWAFFGNHPQWPHGGMAMSALHAGHSLSLNSALTLRFFVCGINRPPIDK